MLEIGEITVLYDSECAFCCRSRSWILAQVHRINIYFIPINSEQVKSKFPELSANHLNELVVIADNGKVYYKEKAFVMCLYSLSEYYEWSFKLAEPVFLPLVRNAYLLLSNYRNIFSPTKVSKDDKYLQEMLESYEQGERCDF